MDTDGTPGVTQAPWRRTYMTGGMDASGPAEAMGTMLGELGLSLIALPDGERDSKLFPDRSQWITPEFKAIPTIDADGVEDGDRAIVLLQPGDFRGYGKTPVYKATRELTPADFAGVVMFQRAFEQTYELSCKARRGYDHLPFQAGCPAALDLILFAFHQVGGALHDACTRAKAAQIRACHATAGDDLVVQIETVAAVNMVATAEDQPKTASWLAGLLTALPRLCPGVSFTVHLCDGDWGHEAMTEPESALPLVLLANEIAAQWPDEAKLKLFQLPFAPAALPPSLDPAWYTPLNQLKLPEDTFLAAGFVHELTSLTDLRYLLGVIEDSYGHEVVLAPPCGLGRRPHGQAQDVLHKLAELAFSEAG
jgi:hypothetical protein